MGSYDCYTLSMLCEEDSMVGEVTVQIIYLDTWLWVAATTLATRMMLLPILVYQMKETALLNDGNPEQSTSAEQLDWNSSPKLNVGFLDLTCKETLEAFLA
ncbi:unnamed protein product [Sphagnum jensenii]|uniref:Uncharacterized protein n=1 Tax=Sphagnum jensenii TaxID=128206 RepID=A0ABP1AE69_9BRYO